MFKLDKPLENKISPLINKKSASIFESIKRGLKSDRLVQKSFVYLEEVTKPDTVFSFKISYPHTQNHAAVIQLSECGQILKIYIESNPPNLFSNVGYEFLFYPTALLSTAPHVEIEEYSRTQLFMLAYILLKLTTDFDFIITRDNKLLKTKNPAVAVYEDCIDADMRTTILTYSEPELNVINISKDTGVAQISGDGVSSMSITLTEIFVKMMTPPLTVEYIET